MKLPPVRWRRTAPLGDGQDGGRRRWPARPDWLRLPRPQDLREALRHNPGLKLISIVLASFLWYSINVLERDAERVVELPVSVRKIPAELVLTTPPAKPVAVTLRGPRTILDGVDEHKSRLLVDMSGIGPGETRMDLNGAMVDPELPRRLKVLRMQPVRLKLNVERLARRRLPVRPDLAGAPAFGYTVAESTVTPDFIEVTGPASKVDELKEISTEPIDLHGVATTLERRALLEWVADFVTFVPDRVRVAVRLEEVMVSREFKRVTITVRNGEGLRAKVTPEVLDLTIHGPQRVLANYKIAEGAVTLDTAGLEAGVHRLSVQAVLVTLPGELEVVARQPETLRVQIDQGS